MQTKKKENKPCMKFLLCLTLLLLQWLQKQKVLNFKRTHTLQNRLAWQFKFWFFFFHNLSSNSRLCLFYTFSYKWSVYSFFFLFWKNFFSMDSPTYPFVVNWVGLLQVLSVYKELHDRKMSKSGQWNLLSNFLHHPQQAMNLDLHCESRQTDQSCVHLSYKWYKANFWKVKPVYVFFLYIFI